MIDRDSLVGRKLSAYEIQGVIGKGGMATIYKAWHPTLERYAAIKVLSPHLLSDTEFVRRFQQEAKTAARLKHANIVTIYDVTHQDNYYYIVMEYVEGRPLDEVIAQEGALPLERVLQVVEQIGSALDYIHQNGLIHRDIKPANILVKPDGNVVLSDFGIAKTASAGGAAHQLTQIGVVMGTPAYMSPEQIEGQEIDWRTDLYALGVVCYEMLTGQVPFLGNTTAALLSAQLTKLPPSIRQLHQDLPPHVEQSVHRMLSKNPDNRFQSAGEFAACLSGKQPLPPPKADEPVLEEAAFAGVPRVDASAPTRIYRPAGAAPAPVPEILGPDPQETSPTPHRRVPVWGLIALVAVVLVIAGIIVGGIAIGATAAQTLTKTTPTLAPETVTPTAAVKATQTIFAFPTARPTSTWTPTPVATRTLAPTPTPEWLASPRLHLPGDGAFFKEQPVEVAWEHRHKLADQEYYLVTIRDAGQALVAQFWSKNATLSLEPSFFVENGSSTQYNWSVRVVVCVQNCSQAVTDPAQKQWLLISDSSDEWTFYWYPARLPQGISEG